MNGDNTPAGGQYTGSATPPPPPPPTPSASHPHAHVVTQAVPVTVLPHQVYAVAGPTNSLATAALTLGVLAAVLCWVPIVGFILALVGIGLGIPAMARANSTGIGRVPAIWGLSLSGFSALIFFVIIALV